MKKPVRILYHEANTFAFTGAAQSLFNLLIELNKLRFDIRLMSPGESLLIEHMRKAGMSVKIWPSRITGPRFLRILSSWHQVPSLMSYFKREDIQLLHCNRLQSVLLLGWAAKLYRIPVIWHLRGRRAIGISEIMGFFLSDRVLCVSETLRQELLQSRWLRRKEKAITLYNPIDLSKFNPSRRVSSLRTEFGLKENDIVVSWIAGGLTPGKRPDMFIKIAKHLSPSLPNSRFLVVGEAQEDLTEFKNNLISLADDLVPQKKLIFTGFRNDVRDILAESDILVVTSRREGLPRVALEAAASGCPVVSTSVEGINELVVNNKTGYIVAQDDLEGLTEYVRVLIKDKNKRLEMGRLGRAHIEQNFVTQNIVNEYEDIVNNCLRNGN